MLSDSGELGVRGARVPRTGAEEAVQCWTQLPGAGHGVTPAVGEMEGGKT